MSNKRTKASYGSRRELLESIAVAKGDMPAEFVIKAVNYLDVFSGAFRKGDVAVFNEKIIGIGESYEASEQIDGSDLFLVPGFIDSHVHIESSLMIPECFQKAVLPHGTTSVIWDPHEIANVKGVEGIEWALEASEKLLLDVFVMIPSCVPSTSPELGLETSGASLKAKDIKSFASHSRVLGLAEMMNFPGLLGGDADVSEKIFDYQSMLRDGHCPSLSGKDLNAYASAGIHSCHESTSLEEAQEKLSKGIHVLVREGSCAKDAKKLLPILNAYSSSTLSFCSDDRNPADISSEGHIDAIVRMALADGHAPEEVFRAASYAPASIYGLKDRGAIAPGYLADFNLLRVGSDWSQGFEIEAVFKSGRRVTDGDLKLDPAWKAPFHGRNLNLQVPNLEQLKLLTKKEQVRVPVIGVIANQILTDHLKVDLGSSSGELKACSEKDLLKIGVFERHHGSGGMSLGFVKGMGLKKGAIATSVNHDSHNLICVATSDESMLKAIEEIIKIDGGIVVCDGDERVESLALPVGGLMTHAEPEAVSERLFELKAFAKELGCGLDEPFLQLSFLALPVIPSLKITDKGLVDVEKFTLINDWC